MLACDVCIVGSGAAGGAVAYALADKGLRVLVLEKGPMVERFSKDEVALRLGAYRSNLNEEFHILYTKNGDGSVQRTSTKETGIGFWNGNIVGGASNFMSGYFHAMRRGDFELLDRYGPIEGANVANWPISYADLAPYYDKIARIIGMSGDGMPTPPLRENPFVSRFDRACRDLSLTPRRTPRAIASEDFDGRKGCYYSGFCGSYGCSSDAKASSRVALLRRSGAKIIPGAFVYHLASDERSVCRVSFFDGGGASHHIAAKVVVLTLGPIETARLLLNSKNRHFPRGLANNANQVGRNLIFSAGGVGEGSFSLRTFPELAQRDTFFNRYIDAWYELDGGKGGMVEFMFEHNNIINRVLERVWESGEPVWGEDLKKAMDRVRTHRKVVFEVFNDWLATDGTYVDVEEGVKDRWGIDVAAVHLDPHPRDLQVARKLAEKGAKILRAMGAQDVRWQISAAPTPNLVAGGCRMGLDRHTSVLDGECRAHELDNLYIADASCMPTGGSLPYTWTIYANALRVGERIAARLRAGGPSSPS